MAVEYGFGKIVTDGLVISLDASDINSYRGSGTSLTDLTGNNRNGTLINGPSYSTAYGGSIVFDGINDTINIPYFNLTTQSFAVDLWYQPGVNGEYLRGIISCCDLWAFPATPGWGIGFGLSLNNTLNYGIVSSSGAVLVNKYFANFNETLEPGIPYNLTLVKNNETQTCDFYINGELRGSDFVSASTSLSGNKNPITTQHYIYGPSMLGKLLSLKVYDNVPFYAKDVLRNYNVHKTKYKMSQLSPVGLVLLLDAADTNSYPGTGTKWYDLSGYNNHFDINASAYNSTGPKYMDFNGSFGIAKKVDSDVEILADEVTVIVWTRIRNNSSDWRTLLRGLSSGPDHQVIVQQGGWLIGMYDNFNNTAFNSSGYSQQSLPGYGTTAWNMLIFRFKNRTSPYYSLSINDSPGTILGTNTSPNTRFKHGICSIGGYHNQVQTNPSNASQYWGDIATIAVHTKYLSDADCLSYYNSTKTRFGL